MPDAAKPATDEQMEALRAAFAGTPTAMAPLTLLDGEAVTVASILARYDADAAEIKALREALAECADDLEGCVNATYGQDTHPAMLRRRDRDMEPVRRARDLLEPSR